APPPAPGRPAAPAANWPSIMASSVSAASQASISEKRGLGRSVLIVPCSSFQALAKVPVRLFNADDRNSFSGVVPDDLDFRALTMALNTLFLGVDGGGTRCRARLCDAVGNRLGHAQARPPT